MNDEQPETPIARTTMVPTMNMISTFNRRVETAAREANVWADEHHFANFVLCVPWADEFELLDEMTNGQHGERARSVAWTDGAVAFPRWEGFVVAWGAPSFGFVRIENADRTILERALRALLITDSGRTLRRDDLRPMDQSPSLLTQSE
jgi:hypothetical protein